MILYVRSETVSVYVQQKEVGGSGYIPGLSQVVIIAITHLLPSERTSSFLIFLIVSLALPSILSSALVQPMMS